MDHRHYRFAFFWARLAAGLFAVASLPVHAEARAARPEVSVEQTCRLLSDRLQSVHYEDCVHAGLSLSGGKSVDGLPILIREFLPASRAERAPRVLLIGGIHGDELSSVSIVFRWMKQMRSDREQRFHWLVAPCMNPDGVLARPATRVNRRGVDLNRNFQTPDWKTNAVSYWEQRTRRDPRRYPGPQPLSEPESRWLVDTIRVFKPDAIVSVHAPYGVLDYDGPNNPPSRFGYLRLHQLGTYPGSLGNFAGAFLGLPVITLELPHAGLMPSMTQSQRVWADMLRWLDSNVPGATPARYDQLERALSANEPH